MTFFVNKLIVIVESKNQWFLYGWRYDGTLFFFSSKPSKIAIQQMYNPNFNSPEFEGIKNEAGLNRFILSVKQWIEKTNAIGIIAKAGRYVGTYAHKDLAFEFAILWYKNHKDEVNKRDYIGFIEEKLI